MKELNKGQNFSCLKCFATYQNLNLKFLNVNYDLIPKKSARNSSKKIAKNKVGEELMEIVDLNLKEINDNMRYLQVDYDNYYEDNQKAKINLENCIDEMIEKLENFKLCAIENLENDKNSNKLNFNYINDHLNERKANLNEIKTLIRLKADEISYDDLEIFLNENKIEKHDLVYYAFDSSIDLSQLLENCGKLLTRSVFSRHLIPDFEKLKINKDEKALDSVEDHRSGENKGRRGKGKDRLKDRIKKENSLKDDSMRRSLRRGRGRNRGLIQGQNEASESRFNTTNEQEEEKHENALIDQVLSNESKMSSEGEISSISSSEDLSQNFLGDHQGKSPSNIEKQPKEVNKKGKESLRNAKGSNPR